MTSWKLISAKNLGIFALLLIGFYLFSRPNQSILFCVFLCFSISFSVSLSLFPFGSFIYFLFFKSIWFSIWFFISFFHSHSLFLSFVLSFSPSYSLSLFLSYSSPQLKFQLLRKNGLFFVSCKKSPNLLFLLRKTNHVTKSVHWMFKKTRINYLSLCIVQQVKETKLWELFSWHCLS